MANKKIKLFFRVKKKKQKTEIKKNNIKPSVILEKPINKQEDDKFDVSVYVDQLKEACDKGAIFLAVDGKYGSGKSSVVNLFKEKVENKKNVFVNINFMNINSDNSVFTNNNKNNNKQELNINQTADTSDIEIENQEIDSNIKKSIVNRYHRYFVNQIINDICKDPYEFEKMFYNQKFSYTTLDNKKNNKFHIISKIFIDKIILWLIGIVSIYVLYNSFFEKILTIKPFFCFVGKYIPAILVFLGAFMILYGYGFYKPDKSINSPILDIDRCRNNFCKVLNDYILKDSTLYLIIDDLDRVDDNLQLPIISLLFNEYYPLDKSINNIKLKFIFMIDINKIQSTENLNLYKIFDYILEISSNQKNILKNYTEKLIEENDILREIFNIDNREYFIGLIISNFNEMRKIKHLLNKILTKFLYLKNKNISFSHESLIVMCVLSSVDTIDNISNNIEKILNKEISIEINANDDTALKIMKTSIRDEIIDKRYSMYIYNFINQKDFLYTIEQKIFNILINNKSLLEINIDEIYSLLDSDMIRIPTIYNECYKYLDNETKIILLGNKKFFKYINEKKLIDNKLYDNLYLNKYSYWFYKNIKSKLSQIEKDKIVLSLTIKKENQLKYHNNYDELYESFLTFIQNFKENILDFDITGQILNIININDELFNQFTTIKMNNTFLICYLINNYFITIDNIKDRIDNNFLESFMPNDILMSMNIKEQILLSSVSNNLKKQVILNEKHKLKSIRSAFENFNNDDSFELSINELKEIINKYGYNIVFDKYIIEYIKNNQFEKEIISFFQTNNFELSNNVLDELTNLKEKYGYNKFYENLFRDKGYYELLIYSHAINNNKFSLDKKIFRDKEYRDKVIRIYHIMDSCYKTFNFTKGFINIIINDADFSLLKFDNDNFWKIDILLPSLDKIEKCEKLYASLNNTNKLGEYATHCKRNIYTDSTLFLKGIGEWDKGINRYVKINITKAINSKQKIRK